MSCMGVFHPYIPQPYNKVFAHVSVKSSQN
jgi:hypothetical protein